jgi:hypothetical protein
MYVRVTTSQGGTVDLDQLVRAACWTICAADSGVDLHMSLHKRSRILNENYQKSCSVIVNRTKERVCSSLEVDRPRVDRLVRHTRQWLIAATPHFAYMSTETSPHIHTCTYAVVLRMVRNHARECGAECCAAHPTTQNNNNALFHHLTQWLPYYTPVLLPVAFAALYATLTRV